MSHPLVGWALRPGSNFEVPSFGLTGFVAHIPLATGKSKKLYEAAVTRALFMAVGEVPIRHLGVAGLTRTALEATGRLASRMWGA